MNPFLDESVKCAVRVSLTRRAPDLIGFVGLLWTALTVPPLLLGLQILIQEVERLLVASS